MSLLIIVEYLIKDSTNVKTRTKLTLVDIYQLIELCESECYFSYNNLILKLYNSGPIGLSIMVVLSECYYQRFAEKSISLSFDLNVSHKTLKCYVDYSHARFENKQRSFQVVEILNKKDAFIQYPLDQKQLNFFDTTVTNNEANSYDFKIIRKLAITSIQIKPNSKMAPNIFKGFLSRADKICSKRYVDEKIQFLNSQRMVMNQKLWKSFQKVIQANCKTHPLLIRAIVMIQIRSNFHVNALLDPI